MRKIILASQSPRRKELLKQVGIEFECFPADIDEKINEKNPSDAAKTLAVLKAQHVASRITDEIILAADTVVEYNKCIMGKPKDETDAENMLKILSGNRHTVHTGVCIIVPPKYSEKIALSDMLFENSFVCHTDVYMNEITEEEIREYIKSKEPFDKAGAYGIQGKAAAFVKKIDGDYFNVVGLPVSEVYRVLKLINETLLQ